MSTVFPQEHDDLTTGFVAFPADRAEIYRAAGYWAGSPLDSILSNAATSWPDAAAVIDADRQYTFAELDALADLVAHRLSGIGLRPGDRVLLQLPNTTQFAVALFGLLRAGVVPVMCLSGHRFAELSHFAAISGAVGLIIPDTAGGFDFRTMAADLQAEHPALRHVIVDGEPGPHLSWSALTEPGTAPAPAPRPDFDPGAPALLLVSGGTTGLPKLIARTHDDYLYNAVTCAQAYSMTSADTYLVALPAGHNFPLACPGLLGSMTVGAPTVFTTTPARERVRVDRQAPGDRHRAGQRAGQGVGPGLRLGAGAADLAAGGAGGRVPDDRRGGRVHPGEPDPGAEPDLRDGRGDVELHPPR
jgi:mycobactin salicyl-AMP ligase